MAAATAGSEFSSNYDKIKEIKEFDQTKIGVKGLVDSGVTSIPKIFIHPPETLSTIKPTQTKATIPLIDLQNLKSPAHRPKIVEEIKEAAKSYGFFQIVNHGVPISVIDRTIEAVKTFHELPIECKDSQFQVTGFTLEWRRINGDSGVEGENL